MFLKAEWSSDHSLSTSDLYQRLLKETTSISVKVTCVFCLLFLNSVIRPGIHQFSPEKQFSNWLWVLDIVWDSSIYMKIWMLFSVDAAVRQMQAKVSGCCTVLFTRDAFSSAAWGPESLESGTLQKKVSGFSVLHLDVAICVWNSRKGVFVCVCVCVWMWGADRLKHKICVKM